MKKKLFALLALVCMTLTASAFDLTVGTSEHGSIMFKVNGNEVTTADEGDVVTVICTPATGYVANQPSGEWNAGVAMSRANAPGQIDFLEDFTFTATGDNQWTFTMQAANAAVSMSYKKLLSNTDISIADITALTYTGQALTPTVTVQDGSTVLTLNTDYTVSYSNNTNAALSTAGTNAPTVTITAVAESENYAGSTTKTFTISPKALEAGFIADIAAVTYNRKAQMPEPVVSYNGMTLVKGTDYTVSYEDNTDAGIATATVTGIGKYSGTLSRSFTINAYDISEIAEASMTASKPFTGSPIEPTAEDFTITFTKGDGTTYNLIVDQDFYISDVTNNTNCGTATVTVEGIGNFISDRDFTFEVTADNSWTVEVTISKAQATMAFSQANYNLTYGDAPFTNAIDVWGKNEIHYISSEPRVAQVHYFTGAVTIVGAGTATITAKMIDHKNFYPAADISYTVTVAALYVEDDDVTVGEADTEGVPVISVSVQAGAGSMTPVVDEDYTLDYYTPEEDPYQRTLVTREQMLANPGDYYAVLTFFGNYAGCIQKLITVEDKRVVVGDIPGPDGTSDGVVDADDVDNFIDKLLNDELPEPGDPDFASYDVNGDGKVDIADAQAILNIANGLNWDGSLPSSARSLDGSMQTTAVYNVSAASLGNGITRYTVTIEGDFSYTGFQMDAKGSVEFVGEGNQAVANMRSNTMSSGTRRVVGYGDTEAAAKGTLLCIDVKGEAGVDFGNVILTTANAQAIRATRGSATGISEELRVKSEEFATAPVYDLSGRKVNSQKGLVIQNGKKVVVK